jgi:hypothetical protein
MSEPNNELENGQGDDAVTWGPILFYGVFIAVLVFIWWMVIYSHGVSSIH